MLKFLFARESRVIGKYGRIGLVLTLVAIGFGLFYGNFRSNALITMPSGMKSYEAGAFSKSLSSGKTIVVHVHADWCPACQQQRPVLASMSTDPSFSKIEFVQVNFDTEKDFLRENHIPIQSIILVFKNGKQTKRIIGVVEADKLRNSITAAVS